MRFEDAYDQYEYAVEKLNDLVGDSDTEELSKLLNDYASKGWRVISIHTNNIGRNLASLGGIVSNTSTDEMVIVFERRVFPKEEAAMIAYQKQEMRKQFEEMEEERRKYEKEQAIRAYNENLARQQEYAMNVNDGLLTKNLTVVNALNDLYNEEPEKGYNLFDLQATISARLKRTVDTDLLSRIMFRLSSMRAYELVDGKFFKVEEEEEE